jgi:hypothetical protein
MSVYSCQPDLARGHFWRLPDLAACPITCLSHTRFDAEPHYRMEETGKEDIEREREGVAELARVIAELDREAAEKEAGIRELQAQKERQSGCEVKNLAERADGLSKKCALFLTLYICPACICRVL